MCKAKKALDKAIKTIDASLNEKEYADYVYQQGTRAMELFAVKHYTFEQLERRINTIKKDLEHYFVNSKMKRSAYSEKTKWLDSLIKNAKTMSR